jgi:oxygen-independent coproporphyrinogen-3 oxidase
MGVEGVGNLYVHFPFCRGKCTYCALRSSPAHDAGIREKYVSRLADAVRRIGAHSLRTVYFGGGTPALCDLDPLLSALSPRLAPDCEFTVELHPLDVSPNLLKTLKDGGVNRISMGVQSLDDDVLAHMRRGYTFHDAERSFYLVKEHFDNAGIDLIVGYPGETAALTPRHARLAKWGLRHCSAYSLILEEKSALAALVSAGGPSHPELPDDDAVMNRVSVVSRFLEDIGLGRYEISNYAAPGCECRHNMATWSGEDYIGLGDGAHGRIGRMRTRDWWGSLEEGAPHVEEVNEAFDRKERRIFSLRTRNGLDAKDWPEWTTTLDKFADEGLLRKSGTIYRLTERGAEVCDSILAEL